MDDVLMAALKTSPQSEAATQPLGFRESLLDATQFLMALALLCLFIISSGVVSIVVVRISQREVGSHAVLLLGLGALATTILSAALSIPLILRLVAFGTRRWRANSRHSGRGRLTHEQVERWAEQLAKGDLETSGLVFREAGAPIEIDAATASLRQLAAAEWRVEAELLRDTLEQLKASRALLEKLRAETVELKPATVEPALVGGRTKSVEG